MSGTTFVVVVVVVVVVTLFSSGARRPGASRTQGVRGKTNRFNYFITIKYQ